MTHEKRPIIVQKYGGSSVADVEKLGKVADRVVAEKRRGSDVDDRATASGASRHRPAVTTPAP